MRQEMSVTDDPPAPTLPLLGEEPKLVRPDTDDLRLWSVTTLIGALDKPALVYWAALETAKAAVDKVAVWSSILDSDGRDEAINYLKGARFRRGRGERSATELGTAVHHAAEQKVLHGAYPPDVAADPELRPFLHQFNQFLRDFEPQYIAAEVTVFNPTYGYAGTADAFVRIGDQSFIVDIKTSRESVDGQGKPKVPYPEAALQMSAYANAELAAVWRARQSEVYKRRYYLLSDTERALGVPVPPVDMGLVLMLFPDRYALHPARVDAEIFEFFLHTIECARWVNDVSKDVFGPALIPPKAFVVDEPFEGLPR
jgi:hypothetical protein